VPVKAPVSSSGKPDKVAHDAEQQRIKDEIDILLEKLVRCIPRLPSHCIYHKLCLDCCEGENLSGHQRRLRK
jgi:hypothetical protein